MQQALCIAADAGVDVRRPVRPSRTKNTPRRRRLTGASFVARREIYRYRPALHGKSVLVDREVALVGSTNMDYRTFH